MNLDVPSLTTIPSICPHGDAAALKGMQPSQLMTRGHFYSHGLTLIQTWISNHIHCDMCDEITYPFLNFNGATIEV